MSHIHPGSLVNQDDLAGLCLYQWELRATLKIGSDGFRERDKSTRLSEIWSVGFVSDSMIAGLDILRCDDSSYSGLSSSCALGV